MYILLLLDSQGYVNTLDLNLLHGMHGLGAGMRRVRHVARQLDVVVRKLAELAVVQTELLLLGCHAQGQAGDEVHEEEQEAGEDEGPEEDGAGAGELVAELDPVVLDPADLVVRAAVERGDGGARTGQ